MADRNMHHAVWARVMSITSTPMNIGLLVFIELHRRIHGGEFGSVPAPLRDDAWSQGGYCIDAGNVIPGGASRWCDIGDDTGFPEQIFIEREVCHG